MPTWCCQTDGACSLTAVARLGTQVWFQWRHLDHCLQRQRRLSSAGASFTVTAQCHARRQSMATTAYDLLRTDAAGPCRALREPGGVHKWATIQTRLHARTRLVAQHSGAVSARRRSLGGQRGAGVEGACVKRHQPPRPLRRRLGVLSDIGRGQWLQLVGSAPCLLP